MSYHEVAVEIDAPVFRDALGVYSFAVLGLVLIVAEFRITKWGPQDKLGKDWSTQAFTKYSARTEELR